jgi:3-isopropylmalate/(R)-2-methylmalate dehydratase small subunit
VERLVRIEGRATPLLLRDVDTDVIIPMRRLVALRGGDLERYAFEALRYDEGGSLRQDCVLNRPEYRDAALLLAGENFGCGSSREPAVWAVKALGYRCVVAPSFGDIFFKNCFQNSVLPVVLPMREIAALAAEAREGGLFAVDLERQVIATPGGSEVAFDVNPVRREALLEGLDEIALTRRREPDIAAFQAEDRRRRPWIYASAG